MILIFAKQKVHEQEKSLQSEIVCGTNDYYLLMVDKPGGKITRKRKGPIKPVTVTLHGNYAGGKFTVDLAQHLDSSCLDSQQQIGV